MNYLVKKQFSRVALIAGLVAAAWSPNSFACSDTPVLASICVMAVPLTFGNFNRQYVLAMGQELPLNSYVALYSLIGTTYGGDGRNTFKLPDLRGKFVVGAGTEASTSIVYPTGSTGGHAGITLTLAQLPPHQFTINALPVTLTNLTTSVTMPTLSGTVNLASVTATGTVSDLKMNVVNTANGSGSPSGNYLGKQNFSTAYFYSSATPDATLNAGAISGGTVSVTVPASTAPVSFPGSTLTGAVGGSATVSGLTNILGTGAAIDNRPSYIALTYYIAATNGLYPSKD